MNEPQKRKLAAILFADIVGYTALMQANEPLALSSLQKFKAELESKVSEHQGEIIQFYGDGCLATFDSSVDGVTCAKKLQLAFQNEPKVPVRIGLHAGDVVFREGNVFGDAVNIASRVESMGVPGAILLSSNVRNQIKNQPQFDLIDLGRFEFKNVVEGMKVYALNNEGLSIPQKNKIKGKLKQQKTKTSLWKGGMAMIILALCVLYFFSEKNEFISSENSETKSEISIAVLPLTNLNPKEEDLDYFSNGVSQEIIDELAQISSLNLSAFTQSSFYSSQNLAPEEIAKKLDVRYLISGTIRLLDNEQRVKLSIELFNPRTNKIEWNKTFDESMDNASFIQNSIARQVVKKLNIKLSPKDLAFIDRIEATDGNAFKLYLRAKSEINKFTEKGYLNTQSFLKEAINIDANFSNAQTLLAWSFVPSMASWWSPDLPSSGEIKSQSIPFIEKAIEINVNSSDAYLVRGGLRLFHDNDIRGAKRDIDHAISINSWPKIPTDFCICTAVSTYVALKDADKAKEIAQLASHIDPGNALLEWDLANVYIISEEYKKAITQYKIPLEKTQIPSFAMFVGFAHYHSKEFDKALYYLNFSATDKKKASGFIIAYLSATHFKKGNQAESDSYKLELEKRLADGENHLNWPLAIVHLSRNEGEFALDYLEESIKQDEIGLAFFTSLDPIFKPLSNNPRFMEIRRQMNFYELKN